MENSLEKKQRVNLLMDLYEDLLTEKQREYLDLYYHEDLSLSEISLIKNVSKNAVFDNLKKACLHLENYEEKLNLLENNIEILNTNILELSKIYNRGSFDVVTTNPPYKKINTGVINENNKKLISRHEITASLEDFIRTASFLLKDLGEFYMVHRPDRLVDIFYEMRKNKIEPKKIKFIYPNKNKKTNLVLIKGIKNGKRKPDPAQAPCAL